MFPTILYLNYIEPPSYYLFFIAMQIDNSEVVLYCTFVTNSLTL
uniref:Uncharacterized protein n=1 Tax=Arundo donax TaxID=35708 RepID=A0A0A9FU72_ARUDO